MNSDHCTVLATVALKTTGLLKPWQVTTAKKLMLENLDTGITVTELAQACSLSRSHFTRMFRDTMHVPPQQWMREQRLRKSKELLGGSGMMLAEIALECGFCDQSHFCRTFVKAEGMSPQAWQRQASIRTEPLLSQGAHLYSVADAGHRPMSTPGGPRYVPGHTPKFRTPEVNAFSQLPRHSLHTAGTGPGHNSTHRPSCV